VIFRGITVSVTTIPVPSFNKRRELMPTYEESFGIADSTIELICV